VREGAGFFKFIRLLPEDNLHYIKKDNILQDRKVKSFDDFKLVDFENYLRKLKRLRKRYKFKANLKKQQEETTVS